MTELSNIDGVGPAMEERLEENGYEDVEALAEAEEDELSEVKQVTSDKALDFIVQAQNLIEDADGEDEELEGDEFDLTPSELSDEQEEKEEQSDDVEEEIVEEEEESEVEPQQQEISVYPIQLTFDSMLEYDVFHAALMRRHERVYTGNQTAADTLQKCLDGLDNFEKAEYELDEQELNELHSAVLQQRTNYQGDNLIDHMDALKKIETQVNEQRNEYLF